MVASWAYERVETTGIREVVCWVGWKVVEQVAKRVGQVVAA